MMECGPDGSSAQFFNPCGCGNHAPFRGPDCHQMHNGAGQQMFATQRCAQNFGKSNNDGNVAMSMTTQPFVPKQVMDIARPMPVNNNMTRRDSQSGINNVNVNANANPNANTNPNVNPNNNNNNNGANANFLGNGAAPCRCGGFCSDVVHEAAHMQQDRGRSMETHRHFAEHPCGNQVAFNMEPCNGGTFEPEFASVSTRSRSQWRTGNQREHDVSPLGKIAVANNLMQHQVFPMPNQAGHCHCMNPNCPVHCQNGPMPGGNGPQPMFMMSGNPTGPGGMPLENCHVPCQRSRSYEVLDGMQPPMMAMMNGGHPTKKKASLPPASHHSPEQRTSYRDHPRS